MELGRTASQDPWSRLAAMAVCPSISRSMGVRPFTSMRVDFSGNGERITHGLYVESKGGTYYGMLRLCLLRSVCSDGSLCGLYDESQCLRMPELSNGCSVGPVSALRVIFGSFVAVSTSTP